MIKSEPGLGLIERGDSTLSTDLYWSIAGCTLSVVGTFTLAPDVILELDEVLVFPDGLWTVGLGKVLTAPGVWDLRVLPMGGAPDPDFSLFTVMAGFGAGIRVENGEIVGDVYVLQVAEAPEDKP